MSRVLSILARVGRFLGVWVVAALVTTILAVFFQTQNLIGRLNGLGADIEFGSRLSMTAYDILHLGSLYGLFIALATLIAYLAVTLVYRLAGFGRPVVFAVAGAVAMLVMLMLMKQTFFGIQLIAGARSTSGLLLQMGAGALGGAFFAWLTTFWASRLQAASRSD